MISKWSLLSFLYIQGSANISVAPKQTLTGLTFPFDDQVTEALDSFKQQNLDYLQLVREKRNIYIEVNSIDCLFVRILIPKKNWYNYHIRKQISLRRIFANVFQKMLDDITSIDLNMISMATQSSLSVSNYTFSLSIYLIMQSFYIPYLVTVQKLNNVWSMLVAKKVSLTPSRRNWKSSSIEK